MESKLFDAIGEDDFDKVKKLITEDNIDINTKNDKGKNALMYACDIESGNIELVKYLVEKGIDINAKDNYGETALIYACDIDNFELVKYLIEKGLDINTKNYKGDNPLLISCIWPYIVPIENLIKEYKADIHVTDNDGNTPLHLVFDCEYPEIEIVEFLLDNGANINAKNNRGENVLRYACEHYGIEDIIKLLIEKGADINMKDNKGRTALKAACEIEDLPVVKLLIENGANAKYEN
jgi:ankyrin repeat protein